MAKPVNIEYIQRGGLKINRHQRILLNSFCYSFVAGSTVPESETQSMLLEVHRSKRVNVTATAGQTVFTVTGGYKVPHLDVFRNGVKLVRNADYTALDGSSCTLLSPATVGDIIEFLLLMISGC